jgi:hypothetical protein
MTMRAFCFSILMILTSADLAVADCGFNRIRCEDGLCYDGGAACCRGGGACRLGYECWLGNSGGSFCCPTGQVGYKDGGCAPSGISDYCGGGVYCAKGRCTGDGKCLLN